MCGNRNRLEFSLDDFTNESQYQLVTCNGIAEFAGLEIEGLEVDGLEFAGLEIDGLELDGLEIAGLDSRKSNNRIQE